MSRSSLGRWAGSSAGVVVIIRSPGSSAGFTPPAAFVPGRTSCTPARERAHRVYDACGRVALITRAHAARNKRRAPRGRSTKPRQRLPTWPTMPRPGSRRRRRASPADQAVAERAEAAAEHDTPTRGTNDGDLRRGGRRRRRSSSARSMVWKRISTAPFDVRSRGQGPGKSLRGPAGSSTGHPGRAPRTRRRNAGGKNVLPTCARACRGPFLGSPLPGFNTTAPIQGCAAHAIAGAT